MTAPPLFKRQNDMTTNDNTITLTQDELQQLVEKALGQPRWVKGIPGLMQIFQCSESTAKRIKRSGAIRAAIRQQGRIFFTDAALAMQLFGGKRRNTL